MTTPEVEFEKKRGPIRKAVDHAKAAALWLKNRKSSRAVKRALVGNQLGIAALTASVAAAGVGGYATLEARQAQDAAGRANAGVAGVQQRLAAVETEVELVSISLAQVKADVARFAKKNDAQQRAVGLQLKSLSTNLAILADRVSGLPTSVPNLVPLAKRVSRLAEDARDTAQRADKAAQLAAQERPDAEARAAAAQAAVDAQIAAQRADEARKVADNAAEAAAAAQAGVDNLPPGYEPFPRTILVPSDTRAVAAGAYVYSFTVDLPVGDFRATLTGAVQAQNNQNWTVYLVRSGGAVPHKTGVGPGRYTHAQVLRSDGGTVTFNAFFDGNVVNFGHITFSDIRIVIEESA